MFSALTVIDMAIRVEIGGRNMYLAASNAVSDMELKGTFRYLAGQEETHKERFEELKRDAEKNQTSNWRVIEPFPSEIVESSLFGEGSVISRASSAANAGELIDIATRFEEDTVSFYSRILDSARVNARAAVQRILDEEKNHVRILKETKSRM
jgi:rubrerythrin